MTGSYRGSTTPAEDSCGRPALCPYPGAASNPGARVDRPPVIQSASPLQSCRPSLVAVRYEIATKGFFGVPPIAVGATEPAALPHQHGGTAAVGQVPPATRTGHNGKPPPLTVISLQSETNWRWRRPGYSLAPGRTVLTAGQPSRGLGSEASAPGSALSLRQRRMRCGLPA